jgi:hypothetical protein
LLRIFLCGIFSDSVRYFSISSSMYFAHWPWIFGVSSSSGSLPVAPWQVSQRSLASLPWAMTLASAFCTTGTQGSLEK